LALSNRNLTRPPNPIWFTANTLSLLSIN
jgi:hypothetical protein